MVFSFIRQLREGIMQKQAQENYKRKVLSHMHNDELCKIVKTFISAPGREPKFVYYEHETGKRKERAPQRSELVDAIVSKVPLDEIFELVPRLKKKFDPDKEEPIDL